MPMITEDEATKALYDSLGALPEVEEATPVEDEVVTKVETNTKDVDETVTPELSDFEKEQQSKGWNPSGKMTAEQWAAAAPLYDEISKRGKQIKQLQRTMDSLKTMVERAERVAYEKAVAELSANREQAERAGDTRMVADIDAHIEKLAPAVVEETPEAVADFVERNNEWLNGTSYEHMRMAEFAKKRDLELAPKNLGPEKHMATLEEHVRQEFPEYFGEKKVHKNAVESGQNLGVAKKGKKVYTINDLTPEQKKCVHDFERNNIMPRDKYIQMLADAGELE